MVTKKRRRKLRRQRSNIDGATKILGQGTRAMVGVATFGIAANAATSIAKTIK
ncbi:MAG: hypothetical protein QM398_06360 [Thermoproteota archaeon]|nr:hypothetical protein [Thermoproteota archaeon]